MFSVVISHYSEFLLRKALTFIQENLGLVEFFIVLAHLCQCCGSRGEQRADTLLCFSRS